jgi:hypothetical protein
MMRNPKYVQSANLPIGTLRVNRTAKRQRNKTATPLVTKPLVEFGLPDEVCRGYGNCDDNDFIRVSDDEYHSPQPFKMVRKQRIPFPRNGG